jgi:hypothetical protein
MRPITLRKGSLMLMGHSPMPTKKYNKKRM